MNITDVRVRKMTKEGKMKAVVSITIDNEFVVHDIKVVEGDKGLFIAMPSRKAADGEYRDIAHPINSDTRSNIQKIVLDAYEKALLEPEISYRHMKEVANVLRQVRDAGITVYVITHDLELILDQKGSIISWKHPWSNAFSL